MRRAPCRAVGIPIARASEDAYPFARDIPSSLGQPGVGRNDPRFAPAGRSRLRPMARVCEAASLLAVGVDQLWRSARTLARLSGSAARWRCGHSAQLRLSLARAYRWSWRRCGRSSRGHRGGRVTGSIFDWLSDYETVPDEAGDQRQTQVKSKVCMSFVLLARPCGASRWNSR